MPSRKEENEKQRVWEFSSFPGRLTESLGIIDGKTESKQMMKIRETRGDHVESNLRYIEILNNLWIILYKFTYKAASNLSF